MLTGLWVSAWVAMSPVGTPPGCTGLQAAAMRGDVSEVRRLGGRGLLGLGPTPTPVDGRSDEPGVCSLRTPLMLAAEYGQLEAAKVLLSSRARVDLTAELPQFGDHPFDARCLALAGGNGGLAKLLESAGAEDLACSQDAGLFAAIGAGDLERLRLQLRGHPDRAVLLAALAALAGHPGSALIEAVVDHAKGTGVDLAPAYAAAIEANNLLMVQSLARQVPLSGSAELARAVTLGRAQMVQPLLTAGARTDLKPMHDALFEALKANQEGVVNALLEGGWRGDDEIPALLWAMRFSPSHVVPFISAGVDVEVDDADGATPLMLATQQRRVDWMLLLKDRGASPLTADVTCRTALDIAFDNGDSSLGPREGELPIPGRAAKRLHVGCGEARFRVKFKPGVEVYFDGAFVALSSGTLYQSSAGLHTLRIARASQRAVNRVNLKLGEGLNELTATPDDDGR